MADEAKPAAERSYRIGDVGAHARVAQGENISWTEGVAALPDGVTLARQFEALLQRIADDPSLDEDTRELAKSKTEAVANGLAEAPTSSTALRLALRDAKSWFAGSASWVGQALGDIMRSESAQKTVGTVTEAVTRAAIASFES